MHNADNTQMKICNMYIEVVQTTINNTRKTRAKPYDSAEPGKQINKHSDKPTESST